VRGIQLQRPCASLRHGSDTCGAMSFACLPPQRDPGCPIFTEMSGFGRDPWRIRVAIEAAASRTFVEKFPADHEPHFHSFHPAVVLTHFLEPFVQFRRLTALGGLVVRPQCSRRRGKSRRRPHRLTSPIGGCPRDFPEHYGESIPLRSNLHNRRPSSEEVRTDPSEDFPGRFSPPR